MAGPDDKDQRKHAPTGKRINDFKKRGEIPLSRDITMVATMTGAALGAYFFSGTISGAITGGTSAGLAGLDGSLGAAARSCVSTYLVAVSPIVGGAIVGWVLSVAPQLGWPPVFKWPKPQLPSLFNPAKILDMLSPKAGLGRVTKSTARVAAVGGAAALALASEIKHFIDAPALDAAALAVRLGGAAAKIAFYAGIILTPLAIIDYILAKRRLMARMRMTDAEVKRENREQEGDPTNKRRRKQRMRELARRRVAQAVKGADVVLVNPTEYAVALRYNADEDRAPRVLAKGRGEAAERIRELARQSGVPIVAEPPLTRMIYKLVPEGSEIPAALYRAVAEVLAYVYKLKRRAS